MKTLANYADLRESRSRIYAPAYWLCCKNTIGVQEAACVLYCESGFWKPFHKSTEMKILSSSSAAYRKGFHIHN